MYMEKMDKLKKEKEDYENRIKQRQEMGSNIREQYFRELIGNDEYEKCKNYLELFIEVSSSQQAYNRLERKLTNILTESMQNIRSSSTEVPNAEFNGKPLRLYPSGFGVYYWDRTHHISGRNYKEVIRKHGNKMLDIVWKGNKYEILKIFIEELDNWIDIETFTHDNNLNKEILKPNNDGIVYFENKETKHLSISTRTYSGWGFRANGIELSTSRYGSSDIFRISDSSDITPKNIYIFSYVYDSVSEMLSEKRLNRIKKMSKNNKKILSRIKEKLIPYVASEQI